MSAATALAAGRRTDAHRAILRIDHGQLKTDLLARFEASEKAGEKAA